MSGGPRGTLPPLDFKAVEADLNRLAACKVGEDMDDVDVRIALKMMKPVVASVRPLLAHARALREALRPLTMPDRVAVPADVVADTAEHRMARVYVLPSELQRAFTVLAAAQDGPA